MSKYALFIFFQHRLSISSPKKVVSMSKQSGKGIFLPVVKACLQSILLICKQLFKDLICLPREKSQIQLAWIDSLDRSSPGGPNMYTLGHKQMAGVQVFLCITCILCSQTADSLRWQSGKET